MVAEKGEQRPSPPPSHALAYSKGVPPPSLPLSLSAAVANAK